MGHLPAAHYRTGRSRRLTLRVCAATWLFVILLTIPKILTDRVPKPTVEPFGCYPLRRPNAVYLLFNEVTAFTFPVLATLLGYAWVAWKLQQRKFVKPTTGNRERRDPEQTMFTALMWIGLVTLVCWTPGTLFFLVAAADNRFFDYVPFHIVVDLHCTTVAVRMVKLSSG